MLNFFAQPIYMVTPDSEEDKDGKKLKTCCNAPLFFFFFFLKNKSYTLSKLKKKGRIKRKITKKLTRKNKLID